MVMEDLAREKLYKDMPHQSTSDLPVQATNCVTCLVLAVKIALGIYDGCVV